MTVTIAPTEDTSTEDILVDDSLFAVFFGRNQDAYLATLDKMRLKDPGLRRVVASWCWPAFLVTIPWLLYRKMYVWCASLLAFFLVVSIVFPTNSSSGSMGVFVLFGFQAKVLYVHHAARRIKKLNDRATNREELEAIVKKAGGVSITGAIIGTILFVGFNVLAFMDAFHKAS